MSVARRRLLVAIAAMLLALAGTATPAGACSRYFEIHTLVEPVFEAEGYVIGETRVALACEPREHAAACSLEVRYRVTNVGAAPTSRAALFGRDGAVVEASSDGVALPLARERGFPRLPAPDEEQIVTPFKPTSIATVFSLSVPPGASRELVLHAAPRLEKIEAVLGPGCDVEGVLVRHPFAARGRREGVYVFDYVTAGSSDASNVELEVRHPQSWTTSFGDGRALLATDTRTDGDVILVPAAEAVTHASRSLPLTLGFGLGVPFRVRPDVRAGGRVQTSASYGVVTLRGALDVYPASGVVEGSAGAQLSF